MQKPTFQGEIMLAGWQESHTAGAKVTFWLPDSESLEVFKGMTAKKGNMAGQRFMAVLVEIGEDELPVASQEGKPKGGELARLAGMWCQEIQFYEFIRPVYDKYMGGDGSGTGDIEPDNGYRSGSNSIDVDFFMVNTGPGNSIGHCWNCSTSNSHLMEPPGFDGKIAVAMFKHTF